jgi:hypothetical protein
LIGLASSQRKNNQGYGNRAEGVPPLKNHVFQQTASPNMRKQLINSLLDKHKTSAQS